MVIPLLANQDLKPMLSDSLYCLFQEGRVLTQLFAVSYKKYQLLRAHYDQDTYLVAYVILK